MTWLLGVLGAAGTIAVLVEELRLRSAVADAADARREAAQAAQEAADREDARMRAEGVVDALHREIEAMEADLALCRDPPAIRRRLRALLAPAPAAGLPPDRAAPDA